MAFGIDSLTGLVQRARAAFRAYLPGTDAWIWPNNVYVTAKVIGGSNAEVMGRLASVAKAAFVLTAEWDDLVKHGSQYGLAPLPATTASGVVAITTGDAMTVPAGTVFSLSDGTDYAASADAAIASAGTLNVPAIALAAGADALAQPGAALTIGQGALSAAPSGPGADTATAVVGPAGMTGGAPSEQIEAFRSRILFRLRNPPRGGAPADYVAWCGAVPGVTRTFVEPLWQGPGTLRVFPLFDDLFQGGVGDTAHIESVIAEVTPKIPGGALVTLTVPKPLVIPVTIANLQPLSGPVQQAVAAELADTVRRLGAVAGNAVPFDGMPYLAVPTSFSASWIWQAIANATGEKRHILVAPSGDVPIPAGAIPVLGAITYVKQRAPGPVSP